jgi:hypothetical protein
MKKILGLQFPSPLDGRSLPNPRSTRNVTNQQFLSRLKVSKSHNINMGIYKFLRPDLSIGLTRVIASCSQWENSTDFRRHFFFDISVHASFQMVSAQGVCYLLHVGLVFF